MSAPGDGSDLLDDARALRRLDTGDMMGAIAALGDQLRSQFDVARATDALPVAEGLRAVVVCGMGGSGVAGDVLGAAFASRCAVPFAQVKGSMLPAFCDRDSLVVAVSFSGNTEETLAAYAEAVARGCRVVAVASGGSLAALAEADDVPFIRVPASVAMPRAALGLLAGSLIGVADAIGLVPGAEADVAAAAATLDRAAGQFGPDTVAAGNEAKSIAAWLGDRVSLVWGTEGVGAAAAVRWKTQLNENAKRPAFAAAIPELDHNDIEGWGEARGAGFACVVLRHPHEPPRMGERVEATFEALEGSGLDIRTVRAPDGPPLASLFGLIALGDHVSVYAALAAGIDPSPVPVLMALKDRLARPRR